MKLTILEVRFDRAEKQQSEQQLTVPFKHLWM